MLFGFLSVLAAQTQEPTEICANLQPQFVMSSKDGEDVGASVFFPCEGQSLEALVAQLSANITISSKEDFPLFEERKFAGHEADVKASVFFGPERGPLAMLIRRSSETASQNRPAACILLRSTSQASGTDRALRWCLSFVLGPTRSVEVKPQFEPDL